jgi:hypothetical protein
MIPRKARRIGQARQLHAVCVFLCCCAVPFVAGCKSSKAPQTAQPGPTAVSPAANIPKDQRTSETDCQKPIPAAFYGTWVLSEGRSSGDLVVNSNSIKWEYNHGPQESFSASCAEVKVEEDGSLSFSPKMDYVSGVAGGPYAATPKVRISKNKKPELLIKVSEFWVEEGGMSEQVFQQQHRLQAKQ